ncbi:MAG: hypothetical protein VXX36_14855 [Verrucomicrobiota bacterium]|nr:hypothetical protein [Verrucomicrobiota bacterium]
MFRYTLVAAILLAGSLAPPQHKKAPPPDKEIVGRICNGNALAATKI